MSYTALYRKWRPASFEDVKGQDAVVLTLQNQINSQRIGHAYLFCGTRGTGKTSAAKIFARAVNCEQPVNGNPCNECATCQSIASGRSLDVVEIDAASNNGVENIREIRDQVQYPPTDGRYRVYIIDEVHMLSTGAFNALLKTLEEPPSYVIFILATTEVHKIPITVLSRCQRYDFKRITPQIIVNLLLEIASAEQIETEDRALQYIARAADGGMRDALSLLDQCVAFHYGSVLTYDNVLEVLGAVDVRTFSELLRAVVSGDTLTGIRKLEEMVVQGREMGQFVTDFIWYMRNLLLLKTAGDAEDILDISADNLVFLREEAELVKTDTLMRYIRVFSELSNQLRYASQKRVLIEIALIKLTRPEMEQNLDSVLERLDRLEDQVEQGVGMPVDSELISRLMASSGDMAAAGTGSAAAEPAGEPQQIILPQAQLEDLNLVRNDWGKIIRGIGGAIRSSFRDTIVEPAGEGTLCVVFSNPDTFAIGNRPTTLGEIERYVETNYGKAIYFKARVRDAGERMNTIYVSDEELREQVHMEISIEEE